MRRKQKSKIDHPFAYVQCSCSKLYNDFDEAFLVDVSTFTFYIINQISIFIQHLTRLIFWILVIKSNITEVSEQPRGEIPALSVMAIRDQYANVSKQRTLLVDVDVAPPQGAA